MNHKQTYEIIKQDFCHLFQFKAHGETLELITPLVTITDKFVSVFVTQRGDKLIITDGGWVHNNIYENPLEPEDKEIISIAIEQYKEYYQILQTIGNGHNMYYRAVTKTELLSAAVFDVANFIVGAVNSYTLEYRDKKDREERDKFKSETNLYFKEYYNDKFKSNSEILSGIRYNGVITINNRLHLLEYVTGSTSRYFEQDIKKAIVNFNLIEGKPVMEFVANRIAIFNDQSLGFQKGCPPVLVELLNKYTSQEYILRSKREQILSIITLN